MWAYQICQYWFHVKGGYVPLILKQLVKFDDPFMLNSISRKVKHRKNGESVGEECGIIYGQNDKNILV